MKSWITSIGKGPMAIVNSIWAACDIAEYIPSKVHFVVDKNLNPHYVSNVHEWTKKVLKGYGIDDPILKNIQVDENDFGNIEDIFMEEISQLKKEGQIAVDMTPGRKYVAAISMYAGIQLEVNHIFYLYLKDGIYNDRPFPLIPRPKQRLIDIKKEGICCNYS